MRIRINKFAREKHSLRRALLSVLGLIVVFSTLFVVAGVVLFTLRTEQTTWENRRLDAAKSSVIVVNDFINHIQSYLELTGQITIKELEETSQLLTVILHKEPAFLEIIRLDSEGKLLTSADKGEPVLSNIFTIPQSTWFIQAQSGKPYYGRVEVSSRHQPYMILAVPSSDDGVVATRIDMNILWNTVKEIRFGDTGKVYVVDRTTGEVIAHPNPQIVLDRTVVQDKVQNQALETTDPAWDNTYTGLEGENVIGSAVPVTDKNWVMFAEISPREAYRNTRLAFFLVGGGLIFLNILMATSVNFFLQRNLLKAIDELRLGAEKFGLGELQHRIEEQPSQELDELAISFNEMAQKLNQREQALQEARDQAMQANRFKGQMLAHVSHDLRTPINAIMGYSELLNGELDGPLNKNQKTSSERIFANSRRLLNIVNSLLDQSQLERGTFQINNLEFSPKKLAENAKLIAEPLALAKGIKFKVNVDKACPEILFSDFERIQQIITNLIDNAIKFTEKGQVTLDIFLPDKNFWAFSVSDTGRGIAAEDQAIIFQPFRQLDELATRKHGGVGLGLSIVQQLTLALNGKVWVESELDKGSKFTVILPMKPKEDEAK